MSVEWYCHCPHCEARLKIQPLPKRQLVRCPNIRRSPGHDYADYGPLGPAHPFSTTRLLKRTGRTAWPHTGGCGRVFAIRPIKELK